MSRFIDWVADYVVDLDIVVGVAAYAALIALIAWIIWGPW